VSELPDEGHFASLGAARFSSSNQFSTTLMCGAAAGYVFGSIIRNRPSAATSYPATSVSETW
jgi:hypothetical protein